MARYAFWDQCVDSRPQTLMSYIFCSFMILLDSYYDSKENEVIFVKIRARFPNLWPDTSFGPKFP